MAQLLCLPEHVLELIVARTATSLSRYETSWGAAALTCKRLHSLQLPGDFAVVDNLQSLPWLMPRLKHAKALHVGNQYGMYGVDTLIRPLREIVSMLLNGSSSLSELRVLVVRIISNEDEGLARPLVPWIYELLLGANSLHTLDFNVWDIPCPPILKRLPLRHLILTVRSVNELLDVLEDLCYCRLLKTLCISCVRDLHAPFPELPPIDLSTAAALQHVKLRGFSPGASQLFLLPRGCALSLEGSSKQMELWSKPWVARRDRVRVLSVCHTGTANQEAADPVLRTWPKGLESFPSLKHLHLDCVKMADGLDLSVFARIPCLKICSKQRLAVTIQKGSWQLLELEGPSKFRLSIRDLHSFLRNVSVFAFTLPSHRMQPVEQLIQACRFADVPLYMEQHKVAVMSSSTCTSRCYRRLTKLSNDERYVRGTSLDSSALMGFWPADPVAAATGSMTKIL